MWRKSNKRRQNAWNGPFNALAEIKKISHGTIKCGAMRCNCFNYVANIASLFSLCPENGVSIVFHILSGFGELFFHFLKVGIPIALSIGII